MIERSRKYKRIAERIIKSRQELSDIVDFGVRIAYLSCDEEKKQNRKIVYADCTKVAKKYEWCCPYDFFITVYEPNIVNFSKKQIEILLLHELHHIGIDLGGEMPSFYIVPHDVEEFWDIINEYGLTWDCDEAQLQSVKEAKQCQEDNIQIAEKI